MRAISDRKIRANRANARASTGPKTTQGRIRSARNALRHALSLPICCVLFRTDYRERVHIEESAIECRSILFGAGVELNIHRGHLIFE